MAVMQREKVYQNAELGMKQRYEKRRNLKRIKNAAVSVIHFLSDSQTSATEWR